jgi:iron(III) transport system permease protein
VTSNTVIKSKERVKNTLSLDYIIDKAILWTVIVSLLTFILYPIIRVISTSFYNKGVFTLDNYVVLFNARNIKLIKNSVFVVSLSSLLGTIISLSIALFAFVGKMKKKKGIYKSMLFTMVSPPFVSSLALITLFGRRGFITSNLLGLSVNPYGWPGIVLYYFTLKMNIMSDAYSFHTSCFASIRHYITKYWYQMYFITQISISSTHR